MVHADILSQYTFECHQACMRCKFLDVADCNCDGQCVAFTKCNPIVDAVCLAIALGNRESVPDPVAITVRLSRCICLIFDDAVIDC